MYGIWNIGYKTSDKSYIKDQKKLYYQEELQIVL